LRVITFGSEKILASEKFQNLYRNELTFNNFKKLNECIQNCQLHSQKDFIFFSPERGAFQKRGHFLSPERAAHTSPGQRPGKLLKKILSPVRALQK